MRLRRLLCRIFGHRYDYGRAELIARAGFRGPDYADIEVGLHRICPRCYASTMTEGYIHNPPEKYASPMSETSLREAFPSFFRD